MIRVVVDDDLLRKLRGLKEPLELVDAAGAVVALVRPEFWEAEQAAPPPPTGDELREMLAGPKYTTAELLARLRNR